MLSAVVKGRLKYRKLEKPIIAYISYAIKPEMQRKIHAMKVPHSVDLVLYIFKISLFLLFSIEMSTSSLFTFMRIAFIKSFQLFEVDFFGFCLSLALQVHLDVILHLQCSRVLM